MLRPLGRCVRRCPPENLEQGGQFIVADGCGHAYALYVGAFAIISFESGEAKLLSVAALRGLCDRIRSAFQKLSAIHDRDPQEPFRAGGWTPPGQGLWASPLRAL